ncbi:MAG: hypothetical protein QOJ11_528 [Frankiales bacterium]|nr:hypothetical protein [Frankiales bacterium]
MNLPVQPVQPVQPLSRLDRLRIERAVWTLDYRVQDLPRATRIGKRRELRHDLRAAAADVGARQAVARLGDLRQLALGYLAAEYGELARRPSWTAAALWIAVVDLVALAIGSIGEAAFRSGVTAASPHVTATLHWHGVRFLVSDATFSFVDGRATSVGGAFTPLVYVVMLGGAVVAGRLWRISVRGRRLHWRQRTLSSPS